MNVGVRGNVLLVGEGDFSLSVSLLRYLDKADSITSSSLLTQQEIALHKHADNNIQVLKQKGKMRTFGIRKPECNRFGKKIIWISTAWKNDYIYVYLTPNTNKSMCA